MVVVRKIGAKMRRIYSREPWNEEGRLVVGEFDSCKIERIKYIETARRAEIPVDSDSPSHFNQFLGCCSNPSGPRQLKNSWQTFELLSELNNIWERHTRCEIKTYCLQDESFHSQQPLSIILHNLCSYESPIVQVLVRV